MSIADPPINVGLLQPLAADWRAKIRTAKAEPVEGPSTAGAAQPSASPQPDLLALSKDLPQGWKAMWDKASKEVYYGNLDTRVGAGRPRPQTARLPGLVVPAGKTSLTCTSQMLV